MPPIAITTNQTTMIGPKNCATRAVPRACAQNSTNRMAIANGNTTRSNCGCSSFNPSTADNTDIAGVRIASP